MKTVMPARKQSARQRGTLLSLVMCSHPLPTAAMTLGVTAAAALTGRSGLECALVAATILTGQLTIGWLNDLVDRDRDMAVGRRDKPLAMDWIDPGTVTFAMACVVLLVIPLSISNGTYAGIAHLGAVVSGWIYNLGLKKTALSWLPFAVSFGLLPAFLSYGGLGGGMHGSPPTIPMTIFAATLGIGIHFLNVLPDLVQDKETGVRHLPLRIALKTGAPKLLLVSVGWTVLSAIGVVVTALTVGVAQ